MRNFTFLRAKYSLSYILAIIAMIVLSTLSAVTTDANPLNPPSYGIVRLCQEDSKVYAFTFTLNTIEYYYSEDGGLWWTHQDKWVDNQLPCLGGQYLRDDQTLAPPNQNAYVTDGVRLYRYSPSEYIESSLNGGLSWDYEFNLWSFGLEARGAFHRQSGETAFTPGPLDSIVDHRTRNIIMAMGYDGVLVRTPTGLWQHVNVGMYGHARLDLFGGFILLLAHEWLWALVFCVFTPIVIVHGLKTIGKFQQIIFVIAAVIAIVSFTAFSPNLYGTSENIFRAFSYRVFPTALVLAGMLHIETLVGVYRKRPTAIVSILSISLIVGALFMLPYVLWVSGVISTYRHATIAALGISIAMLFVGSVYLQHQHPQLFKVSRKQKIAELLAEGELVFEEDIKVTHS